MYVKGFVFICGSEQVTFPCPAFCWRVFLQKQEEAACLAVKCFFGEYKGWEVTSPECRSTTDDPCANSAGPEEREGSEIQ